MDFPDTKDVNSSILNKFKYTLFRGFLIHVTIKVFGHKFVSPAVLRGLFAAAEIAVILSLVFVVGCTLMSTKTKTS